MPCCNSKQSDCGSFWLSAPLLPVSKSMNTYAQGLRKNLLGESHKFSQRDEVFTTFKMTLDKDALRSKNEGLRRKLVRLSDGALEEILKQRNREGNVAVSGAEDHSFSDDLSSPGTERLDVLTKLVGHIRGSIWARS